MRSVPHGSFTRIASLPALWQAWRQHARGKRTRMAVAGFDLGADRHVIALHRDLLGGCYHPGPHRQHVVRDPKLRLISTPPLLDRIVHQAMVAELEPTYVRGYVDHSFACLPGRGPQRAALWHLRWMREHRYRLALDIRRYFPSVDHTILLERVVFPSLHDERTRGLLAAQVEEGGRAYTTALARQVYGEPQGDAVGLAIGSRLSQWLANLYLDGLDQHVKRELKVRAYLRYLDDFVLFDDDAGRLREARAAIEGWLGEHRGLALNRKRWHVSATSQPCTYLGQRVSRAGLSPGKKLKRRLRAKLRAAAARGDEALVRSVLAYVGLATFG
jgi:RNA-directed DNA polymerase